MPGQQSRLERRPEAANSLAADTTITETIAAPQYVEAERPRCLRCGHPITVARSVSRAYGPLCWRRTVVGQLEARRDAVGRLLGRVAVRVSTVVDTAALVVVSDVLLDLVAELDAGTVTA